MNDILFSLYIYNRMCYDVVKLSFFVPYSVTTCGYIILQFFKLTPEESSKDPFYFVLARHQKR